MSYTKLYFRIMIVIALIMLQRRGRQVSQVSMIASDSDDGEIEI